MVFLWKNLINSSPASHTTNEHKMVLVDPFEGPMLDGEQDWLSRVTGTSDKVTLDWVDFD